MKKIIKQIIYAALCICILPFSVDGVENLIPVGEVVGLELRDGTVTVAAFDEELGDLCKSAGIQIGDVISRIDTTDICCADDIRVALERSHGSVRVHIARDGKEKTLQIQPVITSDGPKLGLYLRQGVTGVGTVTWYDAQSGQFATLGHGVNNGKGKLLEMTEGKAYDARVQTVRKGVAGEPGQLMGAVERSEPVGDLTANTAQGVFGISKQGWKGSQMAVAAPSEIKTGAATILSTVSGNQVQEYSVEILKIYPKSRQAGRNLLIHVTDPALLEATGGIVQGMSGSPIIQNGKLIGAVTHVLVNDPTTGYGIFIENMLDAAA